MNTKRIGILLASVFSIVCLLFLITQCNRKTVAAQNRVTQSGQWGTLQKGTKLKITKKTFLTSSQAEKEYGNDFKQCMEQDTADYHVIVIDGSVKNTGTSLQTVPLFQLYLENSYYSNGISQDIQPFLHDASLEVKLKKGETKKFQIGYIIYKTQFSPDSWPNIQKDHWKLVGEHYPYKRIWNLNF